MTRTILGILAGTLLASAGGLAGCSHDDKRAPAAAAPAESTVAPEHSQPLSPTPPTSPPPAPPAGSTPPTGAATSGDCLVSGDGYFRARLAGAIEATVDWPNLGTHCEGESKMDPAGVRLSFRREIPAKPDLLFVFGVTGVEPGAPAHTVGANLTVIVQGTSRIYGTQGYTRCTVDSLTQTALSTPRAFRVEARGFCTSPAHAVRGDGDVLMSTFDFAGVVNYEPSATTAQIGTAK